MCMYVKTYKGKSYCVELMHKDDQDKDPPVNVTIVLID